MSSSSSHPPAPRRRIRRHLSGILLVFLLVAGLFYFQAQNRPEATALVQEAHAQTTDAIDAAIMRVGISDDGMTELEYPETRITATGTYTITDQGTGNLLMTGLPGEIATITVNKTGFNLKSNHQTITYKPPFVGPLVARVSDEARRLKIMNITRRGENPQYRGYFEIARGFSAPHKLTVINVVSLEDYLKAVVPNELPMRYGLEAVKAQSVAARNYAIRPREKPWKHFDICDSQYCQVYLGSQTETPGSNAAIAETYGLVGIYAGEPILALFSSSHGGFAENYSYAFSDPVTREYPAPPIPYLSGGPDLAVASLDLTAENGARQFWAQHHPSYDVDSPYYRWTKRWSRAELEATINQGLLAVSKDTNTRDFVSPQFQPGDSIGTLKRLHVKKRGTSGKIMELEIEGSQGRWRVQKEFLIRKVLAHGGRMLPSANVVFSHLTDARGNVVALVAQGGGFGHGVGMSQLGASWMSHHGHGFADIIRHYYKGASLGSIPVSVGGKGPKQPVQTRFITEKPHGKLWLQTESGRIPGPVQVKINEHRLTFTPSGNPSAFSVDPYLKANQINSLVLYPDSGQSSRAVKAWIELYPATTKPVVVKR